MLVHETQSQHTERYRRKLKTDAKISARELLQAIQTDAKSYTQDDEHDVYHGISHRRQSTRMFSLLDIAFKATMTADIPEGMTSIDANMMMCR